MEEIRGAFQRFRDKHDGNLFFHAGFGAFDDEGNVIDDLMLCYGKKDVIKLSLDELTKQVDKERDFVIF